MKQHQQVKGMLTGVLLSIAGGALGAIGFLAYRQACCFITEPAPLCEGWPFTSLSVPDAHVWQVGGLVAMVVGGILLIIGLAVVLTNVLGR